MLDFEFSKSRLVEGVVRAACGNVEKDPSRETVERAVDRFLHTYVMRDATERSDDRLDCPLRALRLIVPAFATQYRFRTGPKPDLPLEIFTHALAVFWDWRGRSGNTLSVREIAFSEGSPGLVFRLDEDSVLAYLDQIAD